MSRGCPGERMDTVAPRWDGERLELHIHSCAELSVRGCRAATAHAGDAAMAGQGSGRSHPAPSYTTPMGEEPGGCLGPCTEQTHLPRECLDPHRLPGPQGHTELGRGSSRALLELTQGRLKDAVEHITLSLEFEIII